ncbi:DUF4386 family protein [Nodosilinea sp. AN01ver1]|uniref:DUF4386 family protein n=1 Tax=Nodosilinea sp. AN01ver1 TaxID=3423362 RepID=UPI003D32265D
MHLIFVIVLIDGDDSFHRKIKQQDCEISTEGLFRAGFLADSIMCLSDVALAVLLFVLLRPVNKTLALIALCFRSDADCCDRPQPA